MVVLNVVRYTPSTQGLFQLVDLKSILLILIIAIIAIAFGVPIVISMGLVLIVILGRLGLVLSAFRHYNEISFSDKGITISVGKTRPLTRYIAYSDIRMVQSSSDVWYLASWSSIAILTNRKDAPEAIWRSHFSNRDYERIHNEFMKRLSQTKIDFTASKYRDIEQREKKQ